MNEGDYENSSYAWILSPEEFKTLLKNDNVESFQKFFHLLNQVERRVKIH